MKSQQLTKKIAQLSLIMFTCSTLALTGCTTFKRKVGDNSLDYAKTRMLEPIQLPVDAQTQPFTPLYNVPQTGENTLKLKNDHSKRFELPRPISTVK